MKKDLSVIRKAFGEKITLLERLLNQARQEAITSEQRKELAALIAVMLRALFCKDGKGTSLISSCQLETDFIFPLRNNMEVYNELRGTMLVDYRISGEKCCFHATSLPSDQVPVNYLSFYSWVNEVVVDFKMDGYPPLSREEVIKIIADKNGAHYDVNLEKYSECLESGHVVFLEVLIGGEKCLFDGRNLLTETILAIADEALFSYHYLRRLEITSPSASEFELNLFDYSDEKWKRYKYSICSPVINKYNSNRFYPCTIKTYPFMTYNVTLKKRIFRVGVVDVEALMADNKG